MQSESYLKESKVNVLKHSSPKSRAEICSLGSRVIRNVSYRKDLPAYSSDSFSFIIIYPFIQQIFTERFVCADVGLHAAITKKAWALLSNSVCLELGTDGYHHSAAWSRHSGNRSKRWPAQAGGITEGILGEADLQSWSLGDQVQVRGGVE